MLSTLIGKNEIKQCPSKFLNFLEKKIIYNKRLCLFIIL